MVAVDRPGRSPAPAPATAPSASSTAGSATTSSSPSRRAGTSSTATGAYSGEVFVCSARYVPVAGHRPDRDSVQYMADNKRLEVWLVPVDGTPVLVPYRILIGTQMGDLVIVSRDFAVARHRAAGQGRLSRPRLSTGCPQKLADLPSVAFLSQSPRRKRADAAPASAPAQFCQDIPTCRGQNVGGTAYVVANGTGLVASQRFGPVLFETRSPLRKTTGSKGISRIPALLC